jgi:hypothetical protein
MFRCMKKIRILYYLLCFLCIYKIIFCIFKSNANINMFFEFTIFFNKKYEKKVILVLKRTFGQKKCEKKLLNLLFARIFWVEKMLGTF